MTEMTEGLDKLKKLSAEIETLRKKRDLRY